MHTSILALLTLTSSLVAAIPASSPTTTASAPAITCIQGPIIQYTVVSGDTITKISQSYNSGICNIADANTLANPGLIAVGQVLTVPTYVCIVDNESCLDTENTATATCVTGGEGTYTVVSGDTLFLIAQRLGITLAALEEANEGVDPLILAVGQVLVVPVCYEVLDVLKSRPE